MERGRNMSDNERKMSRRRSKVLFRAQKAAAFSAKNAAAGEEIFKNGRKDSALCLLVLVFLLCLVNLLLVGCGNLVPAVLLHQLKHFRLNLVLFTED